MTSGCKRAAPQPAETGRACGWAVAEAPRRACERTEQSQTKGALGNADASLTADRPVTPGVTKLTD